MKVLKQSSKVVVSAIVWHDNKLLLLKRKNNFKALSLGKGIWDLPGGTLEFGEQLINALHRELIEETSSIGINDTLSLIEVIAYTVQDTNHITHRINIIYVIELKNLPSITLSKEHSEYKFTDNIDEIQKLEMMQPIKDFVISQLSKRNNQKAT